MCTRLFPKQSMSPCSFLSINPSPLHNANTNAYINRTFNSTLLRHQYHSHNMGLKARNKEARKQAALAHMTPSTNSNIIKDLVSDCVRLAPYSFHQHNSRPRLRAAEGKRKPTPTYSKDGKATEPDRPDAVEELVRIRWSTLSTAIVNK